MRRLVGAPGQSLGSNRSYFGSGTFSKGESGRDVVGRLLAGAMLDALQDTVSFANLNRRAFGGIVAEAGNQPFLF